MKIFITVLAIISTVSFASAGVSANQPYDLGISIVELSDSTTIDNIENKKLALKVELRKKNKTALVSAAKCEALSLGVIGIFLYKVLNKARSSSGSSNSSNLYYSFEFNAGGFIIGVIGGLMIIVVGLGGSVYTVLKLISTLKKNKADYKRSLK